MDLSQQFDIDYANNELHLLEAWLAVAGITTVDIMIMRRENSEKTADLLASKLGKPIGQTKPLLDAFEAVVGQSLTPALPILSPECVKVGLPSLDLQLHGGCAIGEVTEIFGASGTGKSQFLLNLAINSQKILDETGSPARCIYISTEAGIETRRLADFSQAGTDMENIAYIHCSDTENQDHIIFTQLPAKLALAQTSGRSFRTVLIDSISHHLRANDSFLNSVEFLKDHLAHQEFEFGADQSYLKLKLEFDAMSSLFFRADRSYRLRAAKEYYLLQLHWYLQTLARKFQVAVVVSNQVSDMMDSDITPSDVPPEELADPLNFDFQVGTFSGWDAPAYQSQDTMFLLGTSTQTTTQPDTEVRISGAELNRKRCIPALGYTWAKLISHRILLWKRYVWSNLQPAKRHSAGPGDANSDISQRPRTAEEDSENEDSAPKRKLHARRFARVLSSGWAPLLPPVEFVLLQKGLTPVT